MGPEVELGWIRERRGATSSREEAQAVDGGTRQTAIDVVGPDSDGAVRQARGIDCGPARTIDRVVGKNHIARPRPPYEQALGMPIDGVVHNRHVAHLRDLRVRRGGDAGTQGIEDEIVSNDRIGDDLNGLTAVPHRVAFNDVGTVSSTVHKDARVLRSTDRVVDYIVSNDVAIEPHLHLNPIITAVARCPRVMNVIPLNEVVCRNAGSIAAAKVQTLTLRETCR